MKFSVKRGKDWHGNPPLTVEERENAVSEAVIDCINFFEENDIRVGPEGLYMRTEGQIHIFTFDINLLRTLKPDEEIPVNFGR